MRRFALAVPVLLLAAFACSAPEPPEPPRLVVLVSVDQLRADLLDRYDPAFTAGFRRLRDEGLSFTGASHRHSGTATAVGHATLSTGVIPTRHGIVGNSWYEVTSDGSLRSVYAVEDTSSHILSFPASPGRSPANLYRGGLADWILEAHPDAIIATFSTKDRAAIPFAGRTRGQVYWISRPEGRFVTSQYYRDSYPSWVERFNRERMPVLLGDSVWSNRVAEELRSLARADAAPYEGDGTHTTFPHLRAEEARGSLRQDHNNWAAGTPSPDRAVMELALTAVDSLGMGQREGGLDFLGVSFSQTDYVGHGYGPLSQEQLDNLVHLDQVLGELMAGLDERVGPGRWVLGLSADHGVVDMPEAAAAQGRPGRRVWGADVAPMQQIVEDARALHPDSLNLEGLARRLEQVDWIDRVYTPADLAGEPADSFAALFSANVLDDRRTGMVPELGLQILTSPGVLLSSRPTGTSHGSPYWYDRHVPFVLIGAGVAPGSRDDAVFTYDMAPTLADLAGVSAPTDLDGRSVIQEP